MDEITEKRIGRARERFANAGNQIAAQLPNLTPEVEPLIDELRKHRPPWSADVCMMPGLFAACASATLMGMNAPVDYLPALVRALADWTITPSEVHHEIFPMGDAPAPEWITTSTDECEPPWDALGARGDRVRQCHAILAWVLHELLDICCDDARLELAANSEPGTVPDLSAADVVKASERAVRIVLFYAETMGPVMATMMNA